MTRLTDDALEGIKAIAAPSKYPESIYHDGSRYKGFCMCVMVCTAAHQLLVTGKLTK